MRRKRKRRKGMSTLAAGAIGIVVVVVFSYLAYTKFANPFASQYTLNATFANANGLQPGSFVRIAGVNVGTVSKVSPEPGCKPSSKDQSACKAAEVSMTIQNQGLPIHRDATFAIRPRIFLEGSSTSRRAPPPLRSRARATRSPSSRGSSRCSSTRS